MKAIGQAADLPTCKRNFGLDFTRFIAISLTILIHTIGLSIDGYSIPLLKFDGFFRIYLRRIAFSCVPLFLMLSGFLNSHKTDPIKMWKKNFFHIVLSYLFWAILIILFNIFCLRESFSINSIINIFTYSLPRTWYINMYMGLLVLIPFINKGWVHMDQKEKKLLLAVLFLISIASKYISTISANLFPTNPLLLISNYFFNTFYIFYYLIGAYIRDCPTHIRKIPLAALWQLILCVHTWYYFYMMGGGYYNDFSQAQEFWYDNPFLAIESILMFLLFYDVKCEIKMVRKFISAIAFVSFDMYLVSYIFDMTAYKHLFPLYYKLSYYVVLCVCFTFSFLGSFFVSYLKNYVTDIIKSFFKRSIKV